MAPQKHSALFRHIELLQGSRPWGAVLDAGSGINSARWVVSLKTDRWVAVTGSKREAAFVQEAVGTNMRACDEIKQGNWADRSLLNGEHFDTVLADYLLGAIEGFAPYFQPYLFARLRTLTGKKLYATGLEPYVPQAEPKDEPARFLWRIGRFRDACVLLAGQQPYREFPAHWVMDHMKRAGFNVGGVTHFEVRYKDRFVNAQMEIALSALSTLKDDTTATALKAHGEALREEALAFINTEGALTGCRNYVIAAEPV